LDLPSDHDFTHDEQNDEETSSTHNVTRQRLRIPGRFTGCGASSLLNMSQLCPSTVMPFHQT